MRDIRSSFKRLGYTFRACEELRRSDILLCTYSIQTDDKKCEYDAVNIETLTQENFDVLSECSDMAQASNWSRSPAEAWTALQGKKKLTLNSSLGFGEASWRSRGQPTVVSRSSFARSGRASLDRAVH